jgi:hypothetical protein
MKIRVRLLLSTLALLLAILFLAACGGGYVCQVTFGSSTCTPSGGGVTLGGGGGSGGGSGGGGGGGGGGGSTSAFVFVINGTGSGEVVGYTDTGTATMEITNSFVPPATPSGDAGIGMTVAQKQFLYAAFGSTGQIFGWTISSTGLLAPISNSPFPVALANVSSGTFDTNRVATNPAGTLLFVADSVQNEIFVFQIGSGGVLAAVTGSPFAVPFSPGNMATDGNGFYLYITATSGNHTGSEVGAYSIGSGANLGVLTVVAGSPFSLPMWQVAGEPTGTYMIGTTGDSLSVNGADNDFLYVFGITPSGPNAGALTAVANSPFLTTYSPMGIAVQSNSGGNLVYTFGLNDLGTAFNPAEGYTIDSSGTLAAVSGSPFASAGVGDEGQFDQSGNILFAYGGLFDGTTIVYNVTGFAINDEAPGAASLTLTYGGFWVATDAP